MSTIFFLTRIFLISSFFFVRENDLYLFKKPTTTPASRVAHKIMDLANPLCHRAKVVYILGIPNRNKNKVRSKQVNDFLQSVGDLKTKHHFLVTWRYRTGPRHNIGAVIFVPTTPHTSMKTVSIASEILLKTKTYTKLQKGVEQV